MWTCIYTSGLHMQGFKYKEEESGAGGVKTLVCVSERERVSERVWVSVLNYYYSPERVFEVHDLLIDLFYSNLRIRVHVQTPMEVPRVVNRLCFSSPALCRIIEPRNNLLNASPRSPPPSPRSLWRRCLVQQIVCQLAEVWWNGS